MFFCFTKPNSRLRGTILAPGAEFLFFIRRLRRFLWGRQFCGPRFAVGILCLTRRREGAKMNTFSSADYADYRRFFWVGGGLSCRCAAIQAAERKARKFCGPRLAVGILCLTRRREGAKARRREDEYFFIRRLRRLPQIFWVGGGLSCRCAAIQAAERKARQFCGPRLAVGILCLTRRREGAKMNTFSSANSVAARHAVLLRMPCCYANLSRYGVVARRVVAIRTRLLSSCCHCRSCH